MYLVFDIGGTAIKYAYLNEEGTILERHEFLSNSLHTLSEFIESLSQIYHERTYDVDGIALACPGVIDAQNGKILVISAYPYLNEVCLTEELSKACGGIKVTLENDGKCAGLAEAWIGNASAYQDSIVVVFGTGIGGAIIKNKAVHHGGHRLAGEISTIISDYDVSQNKFITWADTSSTKALCQITANRLNLPVSEVNGYFIFERAEQNDPIVLEILDQFYMDVAVQLYNLQYMYDPEIICLGGGISKQPRVLDGVQKALEHIYNVTKKQLLIPKVTTCKYYNDANLIGALYHFKQIR
ncbi:ROK family protein [Beduini massiliensis]|uniref:ROK family protein n=1 Tax=Beduini massiliensis TaxID=1585974 RepID=UPI00059A8FD6|nr:ROK family protein [Beduini massiliensis]